MKFFADNWIMAKRQYAHMLAQPDEIAGTLLFPILMVVLFAYVFGSAIKLPGNADYREFLMPGIFMQVTAMSATVAAAEAAEDKVKGIIDRFKSMPITRSSVLLGRSLADLTLRMFGLSVMVLCGVVLAGWRIHHGVADAAAAFGLLALFGFAMMWIGTTIGLSVSSASVADAATFGWLFPLTFLANTFVPTQGMPGWLRPIADWNPMSATVAAIRGLFGNPTATSGPVAWPLRHPIGMSLGWSLLILAVFIPLAVRRYRAANSR
ncbi:MAG TPA: ABC transporter permease [Candidatus Saccharimonadia bacterium]|nr:ABC transporter permease [Candidatus Saccharimonadia bacterium]